MLTLVLAIIAGLYQPLPLEKLELHVLPDNSVWLVALAQAPTQEKEVTVAWDLSGLGVDPWRAKVLLPPSMTVAWRVVRGEIVIWRLVSTSSQVSPTTITFSVPARDVKADWSHRIVVGEQTLTWTEMLKLSGWKGQLVDQMPVVVGDTRLAVSLNPNRTVSVPVRTFRDVPFRQVARWDSKNAAAGCVRTLIVERSVDTPFGRLWLPSGQVTTAVGGVEISGPFAGAKPCEAVEISLGAAEGVTVERLKAASKQVNVREDVHRRLVAFDEQVEYEYVALNTSPSPVLLEIVEHPARGWQVASCTGAWRRVDADTCVICVELPPRERRTIKLTVLRPNQLPS